METLEDRRLLSLGGIELGTPTDFWDQPYVDIQVDDTVRGLDLGPNDSGFGIYPYNHMLLDTGANSVLVVSDAAQELVANGMLDEGDYFELGVGGYSQFDLSNPVQMSIVDTDAGGGETTLFTLAQTADQNRIMFNTESVLDTEAEWGGIPGIVGMPAMADRVTTLDMSDFTVGVDLFDAGSTHVGFSDTMPAGGSNRYTVPVDTRIVFDPADGSANPGDPLPVWAPVPFLTAQAEANGVRLDGTFLLDTGSQFTVLSSKLAFGLGLDANNNGTLNDEAIDFVTVGGVGGTQQAPVMVIDKFNLPTLEGPNLSWLTDQDGLAIGVIVLDIADGIEGVFGVDLLTTGLTYDVDWGTLNFPITSEPYFQQIHFDFRDIRGTGGELGTGAMVVDVTSQYDVMGSATPAVTVVSGGVSLAAQEGGAPTTYQLALDAPPTAPVTVTVLADTGQVLATPSALIFDDTNWNQPQTVTVTAVADGIPEASQSTLITHTVASDDVNYQGLPVKDVFVQLTDGDGSETVPPSAAGSASDISSGGDLTQTVTVTYTDNVAVLAGSIGNGDILVTGPNGYSEVGMLVPGSVSPSVNGSPITAQYTVPAPGGYWDLTDNGTYTISMLANEVTDTASLSVPASQIGSFTVNVADTVELFGSAANDTITFTTSATEHVVTINGEVHSYPTTITEIYIDGLGGDDQITITGTTGNEEATLRVGSVDVLGPGYAVYGTNVETITVDGGGGANDVVTLNGSVNSNRLYSYADHTLLMDSPRSFYHRADDFDTVTVNAPGANSNYAYFYDGPGNDTLTATPASATLARAGADEAETTVTGFQQFYAYATMGGDDTAGLTGSDTAANRFYSYPDYAILTESRRSFYFYARGFDTVTANSPSAGYTYAYFYDSPGVDSLTASPSTATMNRAAPWSDATANDFMRVYAYSTRGGDDTASLTGSPAGGNYYRGYPAYSTLTDSARSFYHYARGFRSVTVAGSQTDSSGDRAYVYDSSGADTIYGRGNSAILKDTAETTYQIEAMYFDLVYARSSDGTVNDSVDVDDSLVYNLIRSGTW